MINNLWRWFVPCLMAVVIAMPGVAMAAKPSSSPSLLGSGARALGMGSAFIAVADDATASSWNPAGLIQLETPEISVVWSDMTLRENRSVSKLLGSGSQQFRSTDLNYFSFATPVQIGDSVSAVFSINHQAMLDFTRKLDYGLDTSALFTTRETNSYRQKGNLSALSPAIAFQFSPSFSVGFTFNWWNDKLSTRKGWRSTWRTQQYLTFAGTETKTSDTTETERFDKVSGVNFNIGLLWDVTERLRMGAVYKTAANINTSYYYQQTGTTNTTYSEFAQLKIPPSWGIGLAFRFSDQFTVDMDYYYTDWSKATITRGQPLPSDPYSIVKKTSNVFDASGTATTSKVKATSQFRIGGEYLFINPKSVVPLRAGFFYDPQPSSKGKDNVYGISLGSGYMWDNVALDLAYNYSWGTVDASYIKKGSTIKFKRHRVYSSAIVHF